MIAPAGFATRARAHLPPENAALETTPANTRAMTAPLEFRNAANNRTTHLDQISLTEPSQPEQPPQEALMNLRPGDKCPPSRARQPGDASGETSA